VSGARFTPGPWLVDPMCAQVNAPAKGMLPVAQMLWPTDERTEAETEANARLIAAAPDLYEALVELVQLYDVDQAIFPRPGYAAARAALAKAEGRA
jgi:hypothetical protein